MSGSQAKLIETLLLCSDSEVLFQILTFLKFHPYPIKNILFKFTTIFVK